MKMNCFLPAQNVKILVKAIYAMSRLPSEDLYIEASAAGLGLRSVNSSRSGYMCFLFKPEFFILWTPGADQSNASEGSRRVQGDGDRTTGNFCKISMKSALIVYKAILMLEKSIESCSISVDVDEWRLVFELQCKSGVIRKYKLVLLNCASMQADFDKNAKRNLICAPGKLFVEGIQQNFHGSQDEVTMSVDANELNLRNYVDDAPEPEKVLKTQLRLDRGEFERYQVQSRADITFCLKELRALLTFVEAYQLPVVIRFDEPGKPAFFSIETDPAFICDLVLATFVEADATQYREQLEEEMQQEDVPNTPATIDEVIASQQLSEIQHEEMPNNTPPPPPPPPPKRVRPDLFRGWSQSATLSASQFIANDDEPARIILAPDSDLDE